ncbi:tetratricopeptide repeat protein [Shewanella eurypsychrophilus]|uniref:Tetratricopeptide repeat protein n=1 Tax=Shewanella eurypsychrophilus TaxID=2593656 RepID=A0ABX6V768_9GAMM|nr:MULTISPECIES: tetratricopeptide repeat protein [Shewanella]QFU22947.1 tetratricopeptide repeat protein [Shewanella sp. YLB-09]QPG58233.1 tetratricopeptide repeat protein [Shewanella eurypsychrophilus]
MININACNSARGCRTLSLIMCLFILLLVQGCSSTQDDEQLAIDNTPPSRQDLYDGNTVVSVAAANPPKDEADALARAKREEKTGNLDQALYLYVQAIDFNDQNAQTLYNIARIHSIKGNIQLAYLTYNEALVIDPKMMMSHAGLGLINMDKRQHSQARVHLGEAIKLDQIRLGKEGNTLMSNQLYPLDKTSPVRIYNALAILEDMNNDHNMAREYYQLALQREPRSALITTNLGYSYYLTGNFTLAEKYLKRAIKEDPSFDRGWTNLGLVYVRKGLYARALTTFEHSMEPADALNDLGYFLMLEGQYSQAIELFQRAIDSSPSYFEQAQKNLKRASMELRSKNRH